MIVSFFSVFLHTRGQEWVVVVVGCLLEDGEFGGWALRWYGNNLQG